MKELTKASLIMRLLVILQIIGGAAGFFGFGIRFGRRRRPQPQPRNYGTKDYDHLGCFKDGWNRAITGGFTRFSPYTVVRDCYNKAKGAGNTVFAVQNNNECFTARNAEQTYKRHGSGYGCRNGRGGQWHNDVYKIKGLAAPSGIVITTYVTKNYQMSFKVQFRRNNAKPSTYRVLWYSTTSNTVIYTQTLTSGDVSILPAPASNPSFRLGASLYCKVQYWFNDNPTVKSSFGESNRFYAGIKVTPNVINIVSGKTVQVKVSLTVPILCQGGGTSCSITVQLASPRRDILIICPYTVVFTAATRNLVQTVTFKTIKDTKFTGVMAIPIKVMIIPQPTVLYLTVWTQHIDIKINVNRQSVNPGGRAGRCISTGDPHLTTFDGQKYNHYRVGDYVLVKSKMRDFEIQVRTHKCGRVSCNCGVVVKEGPDVMAINFCGNYYSPFVGYLSKKEPQPGTGIERGGNGKDFTVRTSSGAYVKFKSKSRSVSDLAIHVPGIDFRHTVGMCGTFDGNRGNDQQKPNGQRVGGNGSPGFTESWRVTGEKSLFFYKESATIATTTNVVVAADVCLPDLKCAFAEKKPKAGHKLLGFPGLAKCEKERGEKPNPQIIVCPPSVFTGNEGLDPDGGNFVPVVPNWPTASGITLNIASNLCRQKLTSSATFHTCKKLLGTKFTAQVTATLPQCIADIQILDNKEMAFAASLQAIFDFCEEAVNDKPDAAKELEEGVCPNECNGRGQCVKGVCHCNQGYGTEDCSVNLNQVPELLMTGCGTLCDRRVADCNSAFVRSKKLVPDRVKCKDMESGTVTKAEALNFAEVLCPIQNSKSRYSLKLSNNGNTWSNTVWKVTIYDSKCMSCQCAGALAKCTIKPNTCMINQRCYANGEADPNNRQCGVCTPPISSSSFVQSGFGPWKAWSSCSKPCDGGVQKRDRVCTGLRACCSGKTEETRPCNQQKCTVNPQPTGPSGTWNFHFGQVMFKLTIANGQGTIGGVPITISPAAQGWSYFQYASLTFYFKFPPTDIQVYGVKNQNLVHGTVTRVLPDVILTAIAKLSGTWNCNFGKNVFKLVITNGKILIRGKPLTLVVSDNTNYPTSAGWVKFSFVSNPTAYYIKFDRTTIQVVAFVFGSQIQGTAIKETPAPVTPKIPQKFLGYLMQHSGTWNINLRGTTFKIVIISGKMTIGGKQITLEESAYSNYDTYMGWLKFSFGQTVYYIHFPIQIEWVGFSGINPGAGSLTNQGSVPAYIVSWLSKVSGSWQIDIADTMQQFAINYGQILIGGKPLTLAASDNSHFLTSQGWVMFKFGHTMCYMRFPIKIHLITFVGGQPISAAVTKE